MGYFLTDVYGSEKISAEHHRLARETLEAAKKDVETIVSASWSHSPRLEHGKGRADGSRWTDTSTP